MATEYNAETALVVYYPDRTAGTPPARVWAKEQMLETLAAIGQVAYFEGAGDNPTVLTGYSSTKLWKRSSAGVTSTTAEIRRYNGTGSVNLLASWPIASSVPVVSWQDRALELPSVKDYGAVGDGTTDDSAAIQAAIDAIATGGGGRLYVPPGAYVIASDLNPKSYVTLSGAGPHASRLIVPPGNTTRNRILVNLTDPLVDVTIESLGFVGQWGTTASELNENGLITLKFVTNLIIRNCALTDSRFFALNINDCDRVWVDGCLFERSCRDMIAVWATPDVRVTNNILRGNDDDGMSISYDGSVTDAIIRSQVVVSGNLLEDTGPIRTQAPKNVVISNNVIRRPKGQGIRISINNTSTNNISSGHAVLVEGNVITDVIDRSWNTTGTTTGSVNNRIYIDVMSIPLQAGALAVAPGEVNPATGLVVEPYGYYYAKASIATPSGSIRAPEGIVIRNNTMMRTLPAVTNYSDWGYGESYGKTGTVDYQVADNVLRGIGVRLLIPQTTAIVESNLIQVGRYGIQWNVDTGVTIANRLVKGNVIRNNVVRDFDNHGIYWTPTTASHQDITIEGNIFDGDPFFQHSNRGSNGTWAVTNAGPNAFKLDQVNGVVIRRNTVKNVAAVISQTGASTTQYVESNLLFGNPVVTGFSTSNAGIGTIPAIGDGAQWWLQFENSDPTSATYSQSMGANLRNFGTMPTSGTWLLGMRVTSRSATVLGTSGSQYVNLGWVRLTTGSAHVHNTDWSEMRCLTGT